MGDWGVIEASARAEKAGGTLGTTVNASTTANAFGSWAQLDAAIGQDYHWCQVAIGWPSLATSPDTIGVQIGVGASSSEVTILGDLISGYPAGFRHAQNYLLPLAVKKGERLVARARSAQGGLSTPSIRVHVWGIEGGFPMIDLQRMAMYGQPFSAVSGEAYAVDPGGTANTKGSYTEIKDSTDFVAQWVIVQAWIQNATASNSLWAADLAVGSGGSEHIIYPDMKFMSSATGDHVLPACYCFPMTIDAGSRLAIRAQSTITDATDRIINCGIIIVG